MKECINEFYIENGILKDCKDFSEEIFKSGKSIYEVIRLIEGIPLFIEQHLERMKNSAIKSGKEMLLNEKEIKGFIYEAASANKVKEGNIKIVFNYSEGCDTALFYFIKHSYPTLKQYSEGVDTILFHGERENPGIKSINLSFREMVEEAIAARGAYEAILVDNQGYITEGSKSNIFMIKGEKVITAPVDMVLPGVTRSVLVKLMSDHGIEVREQKIKYTELKYLDAVFISGTSPKVLPIRKTEEVEFHSSENPGVLKIMKLYDDFIRRYIDKNRV